LADPLKYEMGQQVMLMNVSFRNLNWSFCLNISILRFMCWTKMLTCSQLNFICPYKKNKTRFNKLFTKVKIRSCWNNLLVLYSNKLCRTYHSCRTNYSQRRTIYITCVLPILYLLCALLFKHFWFFWCFIWL
jgi:hypothetical protein